MATQAEQMLFEFADELNEKNNRRRAVIEPPIGEYPDTEIFADSASVMSPASLTIQDSKGSMDLSGIPSMLQDLADKVVADTGKSVSVELDDDTTDEMARIERAMQLDPELKKSVLDLARMMELKLDDLTDTQSLLSKRQIEETRRSTMAMQAIDDTQREALEYQKEKDFDAARPVTTPIETDLPIESPGVPVESKSKSGGLFGDLMGSKAGRGGRFARILGFAGRGLAGFAGALFLADAITKQFFGKDLITSVKDGFSYLLDNWDKLLTQGVSSLFDIISDLPSLLGQALTGLGKIIGSVILSVLRTVPVIGDMLPQSVEEMYKKDSNGQDIFDRNSNATTLMGTAGAAALVGTKTGRSAMGKAASLLTGGLVGSKTSPASLAETATAAPKKPGILSKGFQALKASKYGKLVVGASIAAGGIASMLGGDDEDTDEKQISEPVTNQSDIYGTAATSAAAAALGLGAYKYSQRSVPKVVPPQGMQQPSFPLPKPTNQPDAVNSTPKAASTMKPSSSMLSRGSKGLLKTLGRLPGISLLMGGMDAITTYNDDTMSDREKNKEYSGVGGMLAGGAAGAALGTALGPIGTLIGGALGAYAGEEGVEAVYDWIVGPDASEGQTLADTGVGRENLNTDQARSLNKELQAQLTATPGIPEAVPQSPEYVGPLRLDTMATPDEKVNQAVDIATQISDKTLGTTSLEKAQKSVDAAFNIDPKVQVDTYAQGTTMDNIPYGDTTLGNLNPEAVSETANLETGITEGSIREQSSIIPEIVVKVEQTPAPVEKKPKGVVAKRVNAQPPAERKRTGFAEKPRLNNVPVVLDDTGFILLNQGYV